MKFVEDISKEVEEKGFCFMKWASFHIDPETHSKEQVIAYIFVVNAMNFCYWPGNMAGDYEYGHMTGNLAKIMQNDPEFFLPVNLSKVTPELLKAKVFNNLNFSLIEERARLV